MNDVILSSLLNLFALFGAQSGKSREDASAQISEYLTRFYGIRNSKSYLRLYEDLREFYDDSPELDKAAIIDGICAQLDSRVDTFSKLSMLLRLMEFCGTEGLETGAEIFCSVASDLSISESEFEDMKAFVKGEPSQGVRRRELGEGIGYLKTLYFSQVGKLVVAYVGERSIWLNDIRMTSNVFQLWEQSGILSSSHFSPLYHSGMMEAYLGEDRQKPVRLCGRDVNFLFSDGGGNGLHHFTFDLHGGELVAVMGGSGAGKSTLLSLLNGNMTPQEGEVTVNGHPMSDPEAARLIGFVPQDDLLIEELTVYQNLWYTAKLAYSGLPEEEIDAKVVEVLSQLDLLAARDLKVGSPLNKFISGGQRKRLNIALELIREPSVLFLDEPTSGLSSADTENVINLLKEQTYKGKLIVSTIHQPSSAVYKLFDRLWLLDKGGYPVYDGNPIEAISYFKKAANYADWRSSACPVCGNVNPEIVLDIIDQKEVDSTGKTSSKRKVTPQEWNEMYMENRPEADAPKVSDVPASDQKRPGALKQFWIFLKRNVNAKLTNLQYILVTLLEAPVLAAICSLLTRYTPVGAEQYTLMANKNFPSFMFMAIIVAIFLGMSGSAEEIIKDRAILKREKFLHLSYGSYISSKIFYMAGVCLVQTFLFTIIGDLIIGTGGLFWMWFLMLFVSAFLASLIGLLLSQMLNSVVAIYITIPLLLIPQILLCGLVVDFNDLNPGSETGNVPVIGDVIPSRWAYEGLAVASYAHNDYEKNFYDLDSQRLEALYYDDSFLHELQSQLETLQDEIRRGDEPKPVHMAVIKNELPRLLEVCDMEPYEGDWSYESLRGCFDAAKKVLAKKRNRLTLDVDRRMSALIAERGQEAVVQLKSDSYNNRIEEFVLSGDLKTTCVVAGSSIVPRIMKACVHPKTRNGRAHFYSGVKVVGPYEIDTYWFNLCVLLLMCVLFAVLLYNDFPGKYLRG